MHWGYARGDDEAFVCSAALIILSAALVLWPRSWLIWFFGGLVIALGHVIHNAINTCSNYHELTPDRCRSRDYRLLVECRGYVSFRMCHSESQKRSSLALVWFGLNCCRFKSTTMVTQYRTGYFPPSKGAQTRTPQPPAFAFPPLGSPDPSPRKSMLPSRSTLLLFVFDSYSSVERLFGRER